MDKTLVLINLTQLGLFIIFKSIYVCIDIEMSLNNNGEDQMQFKNHFFVTMLDPFFPGYTGRKKCIYVGRMSSLLSIPGDPVGPLARFFFFATAKQSQSLQVANQPIKTTKKSEKKNLRADKTKFSFFVSRRRNLQEIPCSYDTGQLRDHRLGSGLNLAKRISGVRARECVRTLT